MPLIPTRGLGSVGIIKDVPATDLPVNAWSDGLNVRFNGGKVERAPVFRTVVDSLAYTPVFLYGLYNQGGYDSLLIAADDGTLFTYDNGTETDVTEAAHAANVDASAYTACTLSNCTYINRPDQVPRILTPGATDFAALSAAWDSTWRCVSLRAFGSQLVALNITKGLTNYPDMVKVSDVTTYGTEPSTWDETDTTKLAVENTLSQARTPIVDGGSLGNDFIIYTRDECWKMTNIGGALLFDFQRLPFDLAGLINQNCWVEIDGKHYAWSEADIYVHDGVSKVSITEQRVRETFLRELNQSKYKVCFVAHDKYHNEVLFCGVTGNGSVTIPSSDYCNYAAVYNYRNNTWSFRDLPNVTASATANANTVYTYDTVPASLTYANVGGSYYDQEDSFSRFCMFSAPALTGYVSSDKVEVLDFADKGRLALPVDGDDAVNPPAWVERTGFSLGAAEGGDLRAYKQVRALMPIADVVASGVILDVEIGKHDMTGVTVTWDTAVSFDPKTQYKIDTRVGGRFMAVRFTMPTSNDFSLSGHDVDLILTGRR